MSRVQWKRHLTFKLAMALVVWPLEARADTVGEVQFGWLHPLTGHAQYGNGFVTAFRFSYFPQDWPKTLIGITGGMDVAFPTIGRLGFAKQTQGEFRFLVGARVVAPVSKHLGLSADVLGGLVGISVYTLMLSFGPKYVTRNVVIGIGADLVRSFAPGYDSEGGNFPDPSGTILQFGANVGARWL